MVVKDDRREAIVIRTGRVHSLSARKKTDRGVKREEEGMNVTLLKIVDHLLERIKELKEESKELKIRLAIEESSQNGKKRHDRPTLKVVHIRTKAASAE
jgi:hypothetical protein